MPAKKKATSKKSTCPKAGTTKMIGGKRYKLAGNYKKKTDAKKRAEGHRNGGKSKSARVVPTKTCGNQVWVRG